MKRIYMNGEICSDSDAWYFRWFDEPYSSPGLLRQQLDESAGQEVELWINSPGGDVWAAMEMYALLSSHPGRTSCLVTGLAASAATILMVGCKEINASHGAQIMIHNPWSIQIGDYRDMEHEADRLRVASDSLKAVYAKRTGKSHKELQDALDAETWFSPDQAKEFGLVDNIVDFSDVPIAASSRINDLKARYAKAMEIEEAKLALEKERIF